MGIGDIARELNNQLNNLMPTGMFFAASLLEINSRGDIMSVWMGGMPESYWIGNNGELKGVIQSQHMPLGILNDDEFNDAVNIYNVELNDSLYLYSDGITEALSQMGKCLAMIGLKIFWLIMKSSALKKYSMSCSCLLELMIRMMISPW